MEPDKYLRYLSEGNYSLTYPIKERRSERLSIHYDFPGEAIEENPLKLKLEITHTYGKKSLSTESDLIKR